MTGQKRQSPALTPADRGLPELTTEKQQVQQAPSMRIFWRKCRAGGGTRVTGLGFTFPLPRSHGTFVLALTAETKPRLATHRPLGQPEGAGLNHFGFASAVNLFFS